MLCWRRARRPSRRFSYEEAQTFLSVLACRRPALRAAVAAAARAKLSSDDVAVVGNAAHHPGAASTALLAQAKRSYEAEAAKAFPKQGTAEYEAIKGQVVDAARPAGRARAEGRDAGDHGHRRGRSTTRLAAIKKQYFGGSETKYQAQLKKQGFTDAQVRDDIKSAAHLEAAPGEADEEHQGHGRRRCKPYYQQHAASYTKQSRAIVRDILVGRSQAGDCRSSYSSSTARAQATRRGARSRRSTRRTRLEADAAASRPSRRARRCRSSTRSRSARATNKVARAGQRRPQYGWFVIEPTSSVKPEATTPEAKAAASISRRCCRRSSKNQPMTDWVDER